MVRPLSTAWVSGDLQDPVPPCPPRTRPGFCTVAVEMLVQASISKESRGGGGGGGWPAYVWMGTV